MCAVFNPDVPPEQDRFYGRLSKAIEPIHPDVSTGALIKDIGDISSSAIKVAHTLTQQDLHDQIIASIDTERQKATTQLEGMYAAYTGRGGTAQQPQVGAPNTPSAVGAIAGASATGTAYDLFKPDAAAGLPTDLKTLPSQIDTLTAAKASGQFSKTFLDARYETLAAEYRARFPGWRDYIDNEFKRVTGENPANAKIRGLIGDINSYAGAALHDRNHVFSLLSTEAAKGNLVAAKWAGAMSRGEASASDGLAALSASNAQEYYNNKRVKEIAAANANRTFQQTMAEDFTTHFVSQEATDALAATYQTAKITDSSKLPDLSKDPEGALNLGKMFALDKMKLQTALEAKLKQPWVDRATGQPILSGGKPIVMWDILGAEKAQALIASGLKGYDEHTAFLAGKNPDLSPPHFIVQMNKAKIDVTKRDLFDDPSTGGSFRTLAGIEGIVGSQAVPAFLSTLSGIDVAPHIEHAIKDSLMRGATGAPKADSTPSSLTDDITRIRSKDKGAAADYRTFASTIDWLTKSIDDPTVHPTIKQNLINYTFNPKNYGLIARLDKEGQYSMFGRLTDPALVASIKAQGGAGWDTYKNWAKHTFGDELLSPSILELNGMTLPTGYTLTFENKTHQMDILNERGRSVLYSIEGPRPGRMQISPQIKRNIINLNYGLDHIRPIMEAEGGDVNYSLAKYLHQLGLNNPEIQGLPQDIIQSIISANKTAAQKKAEEDALKAKFKKREP